MPLFGHPEKYRSLETEGTSKKIRYLTGIDFESEDGSYSWERYGLRWRGSNGTGELSVKDKASELENCATELAKNNHLSNYGALHPAASASTFLTLRKKLLDSFAAAHGVEVESKDERIENFKTEMNELCDAWHWLHMEHFGEHLNALSSIDDKKKGGVFSEEMARQMRIIVEDEVSWLPAIRSGQKMKKKLILREIRNRVHERCLALRLIPPSDRKILMHIDPSSVEITHL
jgi:hypothetical protein